jgi:hypothetical protein
MEGNPLRVFGFWAGVEGVEWEWIMTLNFYGEEEAAERIWRTTVVDPYIS